MRSILFYSLVLGGVFVIFYLSWISNPNLGFTGLFPEWLTNWTDAKQNETIRTGVPFLFLGILIGAFLLKRKSSGKYWIYAFSVLVLVVIIAELGQIILPTRDSDIFDVLWGIIGALIGLGIIYIFKCLKRI